MNPVEWGAMHRSPSPQTVAAWARLVRVQQHVLAAVEADLKAEGFPPLAWYDALIELLRAANGRMRPVELEKAMLLPQYSTSRLAERLTRAGLVVRAAEERKSPLGASVGTHAVIRTVGISPWWLIRPSEPFLRKYDVRQSAGTLRNVSAALALKNGRPSNGAPTVVTWERM